MKSDSMTFFCDASKCKAKFTSVTDLPVEAYLDLVDAGWLVIRRIVGNWRHYCPEHHGEASV